MKKILISIIFIIFFSVFKTEAFLSKDLGLNLYNQIDKGYYELQKTQLNYELKGGDKVGNLTENLNKQLEANGYKGCIKNISTEKLNKIISAGDIKELYNSLDEKCKQENNISISSMKKYMSFLTNFKAKAENRAKSKTKNIYEISKLGLYTDGSIDNSPFDLINDLQKIDKIIFGEELEYNGEENTDFLDNFEKDPFKDNFKNNNTDNAKQSNNNNTQSGENNTNLNDDNNGNKNNINENDDSNNNLESLLDGNNYICPQNNDQSGLNPDELNDLKSDLGNGKNEYKYNFNTGKSGHLKLPDTNKIGIGNGNINNLGVNINSPIVLGDNGIYDIVNDNLVWNCSPEDFFCITIEFIVHKQNLLGYGKEKSIADLIKVSNGHLKKAANTSLLQAKMSTNNFENILRDLDFSEMFHMGIIISSKSPPILNLETQKEKILYKNNPKYKKILETLYKNQELEYKRKNDLNIITQKEANLKQLINSAENSPTIISQKQKQRNIFLDNLQAENEFLNNNKINLINKGILEDFYKEFVEYEKFIGALQTYTNNILSYIKIMYKKPRGD